MPEIIFDTCVPCNSAATGAAAVAYEHDAGNRMLQGRKYDYAYDDYGNQRYRYLSADHTKFWRFTWDGENRLRRAELTLGGQVVRTLTFKYDPFGRRIEKKVEGLAPQVPVPLTTTYIYDGEDIVFTSVNDGTATTTTHYVHGPGIDEPLAMVVNGQSSYYHADGLGSIVALTDAAKNVVQRYGYDSFGMVMAENPEFANAYTFTGREWDRELGLYYYRARYYDPMEGRFVSRDPIGFAGGDVNLYAYVGNQPVDWMDPWGNTKEQIAKMLWVAKTTQPDLDVPNKVDVASWFVEGSAITNPITKNIAIDDYYLSELDCNDLQDLVEILIHESIHRTRNRSDMILRPFSHDNIYEEAHRRANIDAVKEKIKEECECKK